jgi:aspartyl-tRNA(Asn)/glutamyl-tRNA(Gln) amidotransferase subunit A
MMTEPAHASVAELGRLLDRKSISAVELARLLLTRIERHRDLNAFLDVRPETTLAQARAADERRSRGEKGGLLGVPIAHKDIFVTRDWASTASSRILNGYMSPFDATVVERLAQAGMVCLGKLNCDEFAMGSSNENSAYGNVLNPWDKGAVPGGSSGGSSAAVAARLAPVATATDTGGSIREPAAFSGITGTKPTYGRPSRWGMIAFASSLDTAGLMTQSAEDCALVFNSMLGFDPKDSTSIDRPGEDFTRHLADPVKGLKIGVSKPRCARRWPSTRSSARS